MSISKQLFNIRRDGVIGDGRGNIFPLTTYDKEELIGITFFYGIWMGNPNNKSKKQLIKAIQTNKDYQKRIRREERNPRVNSALKRTANKIIRELRQEARTESQQFEEPDFLDEAETQTSIAYDIMERANRTSSTDADWYANELQSKLGQIEAGMDVDDGGIDMPDNTDGITRYPQVDGSPLSPDDIGGGEGQSTNGNGENDE